MLDILGTEVFVLMLTDLRCDSDSADWVDGVFATHESATVAGREYREGAIKSEGAEPEDISFHVYPKVVEA